MGRGGNEGDFEISQARQNDLPTYSNLLSDLRKELREIEDELTEPKARWEELFRLIESSGRPILEGLEEDRRKILVPLENKLAVRKAMLKAAQTQDSPEYRKAHDLYCQQGDLIWKWLCSEKRLKRFREDIKKILSSNRTESKEIESAFLVDLPASFKVKTPDGRQVRARVHTEKIDFDGRHRARSTKYPMNDSYWADLIIEVDGKIFPFEFKAGKEKGTPGNFMGIGEAFYAAGAPLNEEGTMVDGAQPNRHKYIGQALFQGFQPDEVRDIGIIDLNKTTGAINMNFVSSYDLNACSRVNTKAGLQVKIADYILLDKPMSLRAQGALFAYYMIKQREKVEENKQNEDLVIMAQRKKKPTPIPSESNVSGRAAVEEKLNGKSKRIRRRPVSVPGLEKPPN